MCTNENSREGVGVVAAQGYTESGVSFVAKLIKWFFVS